MTLTHSSFHVHNFFFQANTVNGFRFFDESGKILNKWSNDYDQWNNGLEGVTLRNAKESESMPFALKVSSQSIWFRFIEPQTLVGGVPLIFPLLRDISSIMGVESYSRLGLRAEYYSPGGLESTAVRNVAGIALGAPFQLKVDAIQDPIEFEVMLKGQARDIGLRSSARTLKVARSPRNPGDYPEDGLLFDIDAYTHQESNVGDVRPFLAKALTAIEETFNSTGKLLYQEKHDTEN